MPPNNVSRQIQLKSSDISSAQLATYYDKSWALVIGINDYRGEHAPHSRLANAVNDAMALANLLENTYAFDHVFCLFDTDATRDAILGWLRDSLPSQVGKNDRVVFFFAGHGTTRASSRGQQYGYLIPQDAKEGRYADYVDMDELRTACDLISAKHILVLLDCCFSGIAAVTVRGTLSPSPQILDTAYMQRITQRKAWQVLTAGATDDLALDSGSRPGHSAFTGALLAGLEGSADQNGDGIITATELAAYVKPEVSRESARRGGAQQTPFFNYLAGSEQGDVVFVLPGGDTIREGLAEKAATTQRVVSPSGALMDFDWVTIPAGKFRMGSTDSEVQDVFRAANRANSNAQKEWFMSELPQHEVYLHSFRIARYPVTNDQYARFVQETGHEPPYHWQGKMPPPVLLNHPVVNVTWHDAVAYCAWLSEVCAEQVRLPTEAEWEKAARGEDGRTYPWGNRPPPTKERVNFNDHVGDTTPVGRYSPQGDSPYSVADMAGNVWEWTSSKYDQEKYHYP
jgi:formylglycine-generating enzyme required for sulfatase activity